jgi:hypothetical protein
VELIASLIEPAERALLQQLCDEDPNVQQTVEYFESLPDLTEGELKKQIEEWDRKHLELVEQLEKIRSTEVQDS